MRLLLISLLAILLLMTSFGQEAAKDRLKKGKCLKKDQEESKIEREARWKREREEHLKAEMEFERSRYETRERLRIEYEKQKEKIAQETRLRREQYEKQKARIAQESCLQREYRDQIKKQQAKDRLQMLNQIVQFKVKRKIIDKAMQEVPVIEDKEQVVKKPREDKIIAHFRDD